MTSLKPAFPPVVHQEQQEHAHQLVEDLQALAATPGASPHPATVQSRPAILRRLAALAATYVPAGTDRLIAHPDDTALVTAVALHTGIPFVLIDTTGSTTGELHPQEAVVLVQFSSDGHEAETVELLTRKPTTVRGIISVLGNTATPPADFIPRSSLLNLSIFSSPTQEDSRG